MNARGMLGNQFSEMSKMNTNTNDSVSIRTEVTDRAQHFLGTSPPSQ